MSRYHILLFHLLRDGDGGDDVRDVHVHRDRRGRDVHDRGHGHGLHYVHDGVRRPVIGGYTYVRYRRIHWL